MASEINLQEFVAGFILESEEHLHSVNLNLIAVSNALKSGKLEPKAVRELFRSLHTIKGLAAMVGAQAVVDISHEMEGILRTADRAGGQLAEAALDLILKGTQVIEERVKAIPKMGVDGIPKAPARLLADLITFQKGEPSELKLKARPEINLPEEIRRSLTQSDWEQTYQGISDQHDLFIIDFEPSQENVKLGLNITSVRERISKISELVKVTPHSSNTAPTGIAFYLLILTKCKLSEVVTAVGIPENSIQQVKIKQAVHILNPIQPVSEVDDNEAAVGLAPLAGEHSSLRVDIEKLDEILERLSELIVTRSKLVNVTAKLSAEGVDTRDLNMIVSENGRQLKRLRAAITQARMVSLSELLQRLPLVVRGLTKDTNKSVDLFVQAGSAEVDKAVADKIFPAIIHIIRNSVDHALETKTERSQTGKDETGVITVHCDDSSGTTLTIIIKDDGRGIDRQKVAQKCGEPIAKTDEALLRQICTPGLSTRENVTVTSGRGMGMDIVKRTIELLGGSLTLKTVEGGGTTFSMRVPVSITIVDVISFISGGQIFVVPVAMIEEILEIDSEKLPKSPQVSKNGPQPRLLNRRGETIPFLNLESLLKNKADASNPSRALVINQINGPIAFGVDRMLGQQEVVIRSLDEKLYRANGMNGAADLGDGDPTLVLDLVNLGSEYNKTTEVFT